MTKLSSLPISKMTLGTVQFGLNYGIANKAGKPSYQTVIDIVDAAYQGGVTCLDTAVSYGDSETVLGQALRELGISDKVYVVSKAPRMPDGLSAKETDELVETAIRGSLVRLGVDYLPMCLMHSEENACYLDSLLRLKDLGLVDKVGVSVMTPKATLDILKRPDVEAVQIPSNILDKRFLQAGVFEQCKSRGIDLFVRSIYLQGLLLMPEADIVPFLQAVVPVRCDLENLAAQRGLNLAEMAIRYILSKDGLTSALVGVDSVEQMQVNVRYFAKGALDDDLVSEIETLVPELDDDILMPTRWPK